MKNEELVGLSGEFTSAEGDVRRCRVKQVLNNRYIVISYQHPRNGVIDPAYIEAKDFRPDVAPGIKKVWFHSFHRPENSGFTVDLGIQEVYIYRKCTPTIRRPGCTSGEIVTVAEWVVQFGDRIFRLEPAKPHQRAQFGFECYLPHGFNPFVKECPSCGQTVNVAAPQPCDRETGKTSHGDKAPAYIKSVCRGHRREDEEFDAWMKRMFGGHAAL